MTENNKKQLNDQEVEQVTGGLYIPPDHRDASEYERYTDPDYPVRCPKCKSGEIWYLPGIFGIHECENYWCRGCDLRFSYDDQTDFGASCSW